MKPARLLLVLIIMLVASTALARIWTDKFGKTVNAKFVRFFDGNVVLQQGVKVIKVPFEELSEKDQDFVRELLEKKGQADLLPPKEEEKIASGEVRLSEPGPKRTWTDIDGREIRAQLLGIDGDEVLLLFKDKEVSVPIERFSPEDRAYVEKEKAKARREAKPFDEANPPRPPATSPPVRPSPRIPSQPHFPGPPNISPPPSFRSPRPSIPRHEFPRPSIPRHEFPRPSIPQTPQFPKTQPTFPTTPRHEIPRHSFPTPKRSNPSRGQSDAYKGLFNTEPDTPRTTAPMAVNVWVARIIGFIVGLFLGTAIGTPLLMASCAVFNLFVGGNRSPNAVPMPNFGQAAGVSFSVVLVSQITNFVAAAIISLVGMNVPLIVICFIAMFVVPFMASVAFISSTLPTSTGKAMVITIFQAIVGVGIVVMLLLTTGVLAALSGIQ